MVIDLVNLRTLTYRQTQMVDIRLLVRAVIQQTQHHQVMIKMNNNSDEDKSDDSGSYKYGYTPINDGDSPVNVTPPGDD